ncbi:MAG: glycine zipper domain-containing protein [Burkholderiaceae bacterium]|nr:glycine zipper domain-containing protein [Burkholderiaceae bacterium]
MKTIQKFVVSAASVAMLLGLVACADMSTRDSTIVGAGTGAVAGALITDSVGGAAVGAVVGGVIGHEVGRHNNRYPPDRYYYNEQDGRYYHRHYQRSHKKVRCNDGVVVRAKKNACRSHGGAKYYW